MSEQFVQVEHQEVDEGKSKHSEVETDPLLALPNSGPSQVCYIRLLIANLSQQSNPNTTSDAALPLPNSTSSHSPSGLPQICFFIDFIIGYAQGYFFSFRSLLSQSGRVR